MRTSRNHSETADTRGDDPDRIESPLQSRVCPLAAFIQPFTPCLSAPFLNVPSTMGWMGGAPQCVYCRRQPAVPEWRPFCSERCRMADLGRWLTEGYQVPGPPVDDDQRLSQDPDRPDESDES